MFDNLPDLMKQFPIGTRIHMPTDKRDNYVHGKFIVEGYIYKAPNQWYPAHQLWDGKWEIYSQEMQ